MKSKTVAAATVVVLWIVPSFASPETDAKAPDILESWPGRWSCGDNSSDGSAHDRYQLDATGYGKWLKFSANYTTQNSQQRRFETLFQFDAKTQHWLVISYGAGGGFIASRSTTSGNAAVQTFTNLYPVDPHQEPGKIIMHRSDYSTFDAIRQNGKRVVFQTTCTKVS